MRYLLIPHRLALLHHAVSAGIFTDLIHHNENVVLAKPSYLLQHRQGIPSWQNDHDHIHFSLRAVSLKNGITARVFLQILNDLFGILFVCDQLQAGCSERDLVFQR